MKTGRVLAIAIAALLMIAQTASAQDWQKKKKDGAPPPPPATQQPVAPKATAPAPAQGGACIPSGFARLSRNCSADTGGCQRMPEQCNRGFCCP